MIIVPKLSALVIGVTIGSTLRFVTVIAGFIDYDKRERLRRFSMQPFKFKKILL